MLNRWRCRKGNCGMNGPQGCARPLCDARPGERLKVQTITGERNLCARMASLGIYPGVEMELLCAGCGSPCLVKVHGGTLSLGEGLSDKIIVTSSA